MKKLDFDGNGKVDEKEIYEWLMAYFRFVADIFLCLIFDDKILHDVYKVCYGPLLEGSGGGGGGEDLIGFNLILNLIKKSKYLLVFNKKDKDYILSHIN